MNRMRLIIKHLRLKLAKAFINGFKITESLTVQTVFSVLLTILLHSCAPELIMPTAYNSDPQSRHTSTENHLRNVYRKKGEYIPLAYGDVVRQRPESHEKLSKLMLEEIEKPDNKSLTKHIEEQRKKAFSDTASTLFIEDHHFLVEGKNDCLSISAKITTDQDYRIWKVEAYKQEPFDKTLIDAYKSYFFEKSISNPNFKANADELNIYKHFNALEEKYPDSLQSILSLLNDAKKRQVTSLEDWVQKLLSEDFDSDSLRFDNLVFDDADDGLGFQIIVHDKIVKDGLSYSKSYWIALDGFLREKWRKNF